MIAMTNELLLIAAAVYFLSLVISLAIIKLTIHYDTFLPERLKNDIERRNTWLNYNLFMAYVPCINVMYSIAQLIKMLWIILIKRNKLDEKFRTFFSKKWKNT